MEYVLHIVLALTTVGAGDLGFASGVPRPWAVAALVFVPHLLAAIARGAQYRGRFRTAAILERLLGVVPLGLQVLAVSLLGWLGAVETWTGRPPTLTSWPGLELLLGILPFVGVQLAALHARTLLRDPRRSDRRALFWFQARMLLSGLAPFAIYVVLSALIGAREDLRVRLEEVSLYNTAFTLILLGIFLGFLPFLLKNTWSTSRLPAGDLRGLLEDVARRSGFEYRELLQWNTGGQMANAAIVGFTRRSRVVLFTDALLQQLQPRELAAVFAHEIGHARRHHAATFVVFVVIVFVGAQVLLDLVDLGDEWLGVAIFLALLGLWLVAFGFLSRRFELDADLASLEVLGDPLPLASALVRVTGAHAHEKDGWRHFSTGRRVRFLVAASQDPELGQRLRRTLRRWSRAGAWVAVALILFWCMRLIQLRPEEELIADLRLGHWQSAEARVAGGLEVEPALGALLERAATLEEGADATGLEALALAAAEARDWPAARDLLDLASLRGGTGLGVAQDLVAELLPRALEAEPLSLEEREAQLAFLDEAWRAALRDPVLGLDAPPRPGAMLRR